MTATADGSTQPNVWGEVEWGQPDIVLSAFLGQGLDDELEARLTLVVRGRVIVGTAISGTRWFAEQVEQDGGDPDDETNLSVMAVAYRLLRDRTSRLEQVAALPQDHEFTEGELAIARDFTPFVHLKDAQVRIDASVPVSYPDGLYMRVRLASIDAWHNGSVSTR